MWSGSPEVAAAADTVNEALDDPLPLAGVGDLRVELQAVEAPFLVRHAGQGRVVRGADGMKAGRQGVDPVAVAHPDVQQAVALGAGVVLDVPQQPGVAAGAHLGVAVLAMGRRGDLAAELGGHGLHAVADAEHRDAEFEDGVVRPWRLVLVDRLRPAGEDHALGAEVA